MENAILFRFGKEGKNILTTDMVTAIVVAIVAIIENKQ